MSELVEKKQLSSDSPTVQYAELSGKQAAKVKIDVPVTKIVDDVLIVDWDGPNDSENPKKYGRVLAPIYRG
jgi:hypothetical protein